MAVFTDDCCLLGNLRGITPYIGEAKLCVLGWFQRDHGHGHDAAFGLNVRASSSAFLTVECTWCVLKNLYGVGGGVNPLSFSPSLPLH